MLDIVYGETDRQDVVSRLTDVLSGMRLDGSFYIGYYPIIASADEQVIIDALLVTEQYGLIAFIFSGSMPPSADAGAWRQLQDAQDRLFFAIEANLGRHDELRAGRRLGVKVETITLFPTAPVLQNGVKGKFAGLDNIQDVIRTCTPVDAAYRRPLEGALQRVTTIKPRKKRGHVTNLNSKGGILKEIEKGIANLDQWQKKAAVEMPDGPQRIRGLAGSGKTVALALKAAYLHSCHPDWDIAVTFYTRSLYQQFKDLIRRFSFEHSNDEPSWDRLRILHAWGGRDQDGVYTEIARHVNVVPRDFLYGKSRYGMNDAFRGICRELVQQTSLTLGPPLYDAVLIDEAQDLPPEFFQLVYRFTTEPKRIVWAYDELQTLSESVMPDTTELFGKDDAGNPLVELNNAPGGPRDDVILPVCYRNSPWALTIAHALGFGIYRRPKLVQHFDDPLLWDEVGYQVLDGALELGAEVTIGRKKGSYPPYFEEFPKPADAVVSTLFSSELEQAEWIAESIQENLSRDELEADDILIILPIALTTRDDAAVIRDALGRRNIASHLAGVITSRDEIFIRGSVAIANIYRSKGNEAPMVYLANAQRCVAGYELIKMRNTLFTAITRSRAWVRICAWGDNGSELQREIDAVRDNRYHLSFRIPTKPQLKELRHIHRDRTEGGKAKIKQAEKQLNSALSDLLSGDVPLEVLPPELREKLKQLSIRAEGAG